MGSYATVPGGIGPAADLSCQIVYFVGELSGIEPLTSSLRNSGLTYFQQLD
jgi:hypothetical protein